MKDNSNIQENNAVDVNTGKENSSCLNTPTKKRFAVLISGNGSTLQALIDATKKGKIDADICLVISSSPDAYGLERAKKAGIRTEVVHIDGYADEVSRDGHIVTLLREEKVSFVVLAGYLAILSKEFIEVYKNRIINVHPSLLPKYGGKGMYGLNVHKAVIDAKETVSGATVHLVDDGIDTGDIIEQASIKVKKNDTPESLQKRIQEKVERKLLVNTLAQLCK